MTTKTTKTCTVRLDGARATAYADDVGVVRIYDDVAGYYTVCHALTPRQEVRVRRLTMDECWTKAEARAWVRQHGDDDELDQHELEMCFLALYERPADAQDRREGLWSHCCDYVRA